MVDQGKALADIEQSEDKSSIISQFVQAALGCPGRFVTYGIVTFGLGQALYKVLLSRGPETLGQENGLVEQLQVGLAMSASIAFFFRSIQIDLWESRFDLLRSFGRIRSWTRVRSMA